MPVVAITTDGYCIARISKQSPNQGQAQSFHIKVVPALFTVNPYTHQVIPLAYGLISESDLRQRILELANESWRKGR